MECMTINTLPPCCDKYCAYGYGGFSIVYFDPNYMPQVAFKIYRSYISNERRKIILMN